MTENIVDVDLDLLGMVQLVLRLCAGLPDRREIDAVQTGRFDSPASKTRESCLRSRLASVPARSPGCKNCPPARVGLERTRTHDAAVLAEEKAVSVTQPTDFIPGSMKWPQPRHQDAQQNEAQIARKSILDLGASHAEYRFRRSRARSWIMRLGQTHPGSHCDRGTYSASTIRLYPPSTRTVKSGETAKLSFLGILAIFWTNRSPSSMHRGV